MTARDLLREMSGIDAACGTARGNTHQVPAVYVVHATLWAEIARAMQRLAVKEASDG